VSAEPTRIPTIDVHAHAVIPAALRHGQSAKAKAAETRQIETFGERSVAVNRELAASLTPLLTQTATRLDAMDATSVDIQLVSPTPLHYHEWAGKKLSRVITAEVNAGVAELCAERPERLLGLGIVPLHHPKLAAELLAHAVNELGLRGVEIPTSAGGRELSDPSLEVFWSAAEALDALVFIHPWGCSLGARLNQHYLANIVGQPIETTLALSHLIFSGLLDRHPKLKVIAAHGGGYLPFYIGRSDQAWQVRPESRTAAERPSEYLRRLYYDSLVFQPAALAVLVAQVGAGQVLLGTDFPFEMGISDPLDWLAQAPLGEAGHELVRGANAARLLGL
jgi:aminocarboxymuconate-semialdehyde decarboxylase